MVPWRWGGLRRSREEERTPDLFRRDMDTLHQQMDRLFDQFWTGWREPWTLPETWGGELVPTVDETEDDKAYHVKVELPGMDQKDVDVTLADGVLTIKGEKKMEEEQKGKDFYRKERSFGSFRRTLALPVEVDESKVYASFKNGVLSIDLPKSAEAKKRVKQIPVEGR
jgi:HSP20 family protein